MSTLRSNGMFKYNRIEKFKYGKEHFEFHIDRNNQVYDVKRSKILSWKQVTNKDGKRKSIPDQIDSQRDVELFNKIKGNPYPLALVKVMAEIDYQNMD